MKLLSSSNSLAFVHSLRIALDGEGIETYCTDADTALSSIAGPMTGSAARIYVLHEEDWERAVEIMRELSGPTKTQTVEASRRAALPVWFWIAASAVFVAFLVGVLSN
jgi:hypothetical protein